MIKQLGGFQMAHVAYRGTSASVNDLAGGHIPLVIGAATALMPLASEGKIKILAVTVGPAIRTCFPTCRRSARRFLASTC